MRLFELSTQALAPSREQLINMVSDAHERGDWNVIDAISEIFSTTHYFDWERNKNYIEFTTNIKELEKSLAIAANSDERFINRLTRKIKEQEPL